MWESKLQRNKEQHESETNQVRFCPSWLKVEERPGSKTHPLLFLQLLDELSRTQSSVSEQQERSQQLQQEMRQRLQEKQQTIRAQREQVHNTHCPVPLCRERK